jgi:hypothetical protein
MMKRSRAKQWALAGAGLIAGFCTLAPAAAAGVDMYDGDWHYDLTLNIWPPFVKATYNFDLPPALAARAPGLGGGGSVQVNPDKYLSYVQFGFAGGAEARKGNWAIFTDLMYLKLSGSSSIGRTITGPRGDVTLPLAANGDWGANITIWTLAPSYTVARGDAGSLDLFGGLRYAGMNNSLKWGFSVDNGVLGRSGEVSETVGLWDGIVGARGEYRLSSDGIWFLPYYVDVGAGNDTNWTWQANVGVGYRFNWGSVVLSFRDLSYYQNSTKPIQSLYLQGPQLAVNFHW